MFESPDLFLGWVICTWVIASIFLGIHDALQASNDELHIRLMKHLDEIIHRVRVEKRDDVYYWYDEDNHNFLAQGTTDDEIINNLKRRFPDHIFYLPTNHFISEKTSWQPKLAKTTPDLTK
jgi:hypothetical protein